MPTLIKHRAGRMVLANDAFTHVDDAEELPPGDVFISLARFQAEGDRLMSEGRAVGGKRRTEHLPEAGVLGAGAAERHLVEFLALLIDA